MIDLRWPWLAAGLVLVILGLLYRWWRRPGAPRTAVLVARTARLRALPRYRKLSRRRLVLASVATFGALLTTGGAIAVAARPVTHKVLEPDRSARDIQLCLDVSASMDRWNQQVVAAFEQLVDGLAGERIGMTIFSGASVTVLPLTDDYRYVRRALDEAESAFRTSDLSYFAGAETVERRASQLGDGLASCVQRIEDLEDRRGRAVVLATANDPLGEPVFTPDDAAEQAVRAEVVVYALGTPDLAGRPDSTRELRDVAESTGGSLTILGEDDVRDVVDGIQQLERTRLSQRPEIVELDRPQPAIGVVVGGAVILVGVLVAGRRL